jgi:hypothetical protein
METHDVGSLHLSVVTVKKGTPFLFRSRTFELDSPYRYSNDFVIRLGRKALVVGKWGKSPASNLVEHFLRAMEGRVLTPDGDARGTRASRGTTFAWDELTDEQFEEMIELRRTQFGLGALDSEAF